MRRLGKVLRCIAGTGSHLEHAGELRTGDGGNGTFTLQGGGAISTDKGNMGFSAGSAGVTNILGGNRTNTRAILVGVSGEGKLNIGAQGGIAKRERLNLAGKGIVNMTGGSWTLNNTLAIGANGTGNFSVTNGRKVS